MLGFARTLLDGTTSPATPAAIRTPVHAHRTCGWERHHPGWHGGEGCSPDAIFALRPAVGEALIAALG